MSYSHNPSYSFQAQDHKISAEEYPKKQLKVQYSFKQTCKRRIKGIFEDLQRANKQVSSFLLITDGSSLRILSSFMRMMELMELNVLAVDRIDNYRNSYPNQHAIYFLSCSDESIKALLDDFKDKQSAKYSRVHLFFLNHLSPEIMRRLSASPLLLERVLTFKEFNLDFSCKFDNLFSLEMIGDLKVLYSSKIDEFKLATQQIGDKLSTVLLSLEKINSVEIMFNKAENNVSQQIAEAAHIRINEAMQKMKAENSDHLDQTAGKTTIVIIDRAFDPLTPLIRDFYYQPMMYDLLEKSIDNDIIMYSMGEDKMNKPIQKKALLNEQDNLFKMYRFQHIGEVMTGISKEFNQFVESNQTAKLKMGVVDDLDFKKMSEIVRSLPQYQELLEKYNMHMKIIEDTWSVFEKKGLKNVGELEQTLATGLEASGETAKEKVLISEILSQLQGHTLDENDKLRLVLIATLTMKLTDKYRNELTLHLSAEKQKAFDNIVYLGINPSNSGDVKSKSKMRISKESMQKAKHRLQQQTFDLSRTTAEVESIISEFILDFKTNSHNFKIPNNFMSIQINCEEGPQKTYGKSLSHRNHLANILGGETEHDETPDGVQKLIIFFAGGISYSEMRSIRNILGQQDQDFVTIIGGTSFCTPNQYVKQILQFGKDSN